MRLGLVIFVLAHFGLMSSVTGANQNYLVIDHVTLLDGQGGPGVPDSWVSIANGRIQALGQGDPPKSAQVIDGRGKFLIPGLIDAHVHVGGGRIRNPDGAGDIEERIRSTESSLHGYLYSGVTTIFDSGNFAEFIFPIRDRVRRGDIQSPRIYASGGVVAFPGGYGAGPGATIIGSEDDLHRIEQHLDHKPDMVKILVDPQGRRGIPEAPTFTHDLLTKIVARIHARGIRATVHIPTESEARLSIDAGIDALAHLPARTNMSEEFISYAREHGTPMATTLAVFSNIAEVAENPAMFDTPLYQAILPQRELDRQKTTERERYISSGMSSFFARMLPAMQKNLLSLYEGGVTLALGTDRSDGPAVHRELMLLVESGVPEEAVLRMATLNAAIYLGIEDNYGSIEVGKYADMVLLNADPLTDIAHVQDIETVILAGRIIDRTALDLPIND